MSPAWGCTRDKASIVVYQEEEDLKAKGRYFAQGQGPSMEEMKGSWIRYTTVARTEDKEQVRRRPMPLLLLRDAWPRPHRPGVPVRMALRVCVPEGGRCGPARRQSAAPEARLRLQEL